MRRLGGVLAGVVLSGVAGTATGWHADPHPDADRVYWSIRAPVWWVVWRHIEVVV